MRLLYVSQYYPPEMGAPAARVSAFARRWAAAGHEVTVLTTFPNHPTGIIPAGYRGRLRMEERDRGVRIVRTFLYAAANRGIVKRSLCYGSFALSAVLQGYGPIGRPDVVVASSPQFLVGLSGLALARLKRAPLVLEIRDLWPDSIVAVGALPAESAVIRGLQVLERYLYRHADLVVSVTRSFVPHLRAGGAQRVEVVTNGADVGMFGAPRDPEADKARFGLSGRFVASFVGTLGMAHGLETVLDAAERLRDDRRFLFWLVGEGARRGALETDARRRGLGNVRFEGQVPRAEIPAVLGASDAALVLLKPEPLFETVLPSKMFEAMAAGTPVVLGVQGESADVLRECRAGIAIPPGDGSALAGALRTIAADPAGAAEFGRCGKRAIVERFSHDRLAAEYLDILREVAREAR